jgi:hypothetical protein
MLPHVNLFSVFLLHSALKASKRDGLVLCEGSLQPFISPENKIGKGLFRRILGEC